MRANAFHQVGSAAGTQMRAVAGEVRGQLLVSEALVTGYAVRHRVVEAVPEKKGSLFGARVSGSSAVKVIRLVVIEHQAVARRDRLHAPWTLPLSHLLCF
jgi:hypothetical protein